LLGLDPAIGLRDVRPSGLFLRYYGQQVVSLRLDNWIVHPFIYDWRKDIRQSADELAVFIDRAFPNQPVHFIAHSMGGLVVRAFMTRHPEKWAALKDPGGLRRGGRFIMLGTPNFGSLGAVQLMFGLNEILDIVDGLDCVHNKAALLQI